MFVKELFELLDGGFGFCKGCGGGRDRVAWHRYGESVLLHPRYNEMTFRKYEETAYDSGEYLLHYGSCTFGFRFASI